MKIELSAKLRRMGDVEKKIVGIRSTVRDVNPLGKLVPAGESSRCARIRCNLIHK